MLSYKPLQLEVSQSPVSLWAFDTMETNHFIVCSGALLIFLNYMFISLLKVCIERF